MSANQTIEEFFRSGSTWVRADFHLHTKADAEFVYSGDEKFYFSSYVEALVTAQIRIGVITNHNKFDKQEFEGLRKTALKRGIMLFPGVELSAGDGANGIHVNIVFSEAWLEQNQDYINPFLSTLFPGKTVQQYQNENGRSDKSLLQVVEELEKVGRDYGLMFAHVEENKGLWKELSGGKLSDWQDKRYDDLRLRTLGFQKVRTRDLRTKVQTWLGPWYPAELEGSDCKKIKEIGKGDPCYLKVGAFNFEAVKFALRDWPNRVAKEPLLHKRSYIKSVRFDGGTLNGHEVNFSPELNTLIGIRGSGKSSIIEAIRYGLDIPFGDKPQDSEYKQKLIRHTLGSGGKITITAVDRFGQEYEIRRIWDHRPEVFVNSIQQPGVTIRETVISKPLYFGQKDLSSSGEGFEKDLVEKLLGSGIDEIRQKIEEQKGKVQQAVQRYKKLSDLATRKEEQTQKKQNAEFQLERYRKYGLEEKLQKQIDFDADARKIAEMNQSVEQFRSALSAVLTEHEDTLRNHVLYKSKQNLEFFSGYFLVYQTVLKLLDSVVASLSNLQQVSPELTKKKTDFTAIISGLKEQFAATERTIADELKEAGIPSIRPDEFRQLNKIIEQTKAILEELEKEQTKSDTIYKELLSELSALGDLWHQEYLLIKAEMDKVNATHSSLSIDVEYKDDKEAYKTFLREMMRGSNLRETLFVKLTEQFADMGEIFKDKSKADEFLGNYSGVFWEYFIAELETLLVWKVPNKFTIRYKGKELREHSLGQRSSALILFVLSQREHDVIIIDQPEDDLDNQTIYQDVIKLIHGLKQDTQFIFATHNPNFPVLGDAEMVVSCEYLNDQVVVHPGSIDDKAVQERIVNIMEGGEEAFNRRKEIYGIWKPQNSSK